MKNDSNKSGGASTGFVGLLQLAFIILKLCHVIKWSWLWVLSPTWITTILVIIIIVAYVKIMR